MPFTNCTFYIISVLFFICFAFVISILNIFHSLSNRWFRKLFLFNSFHRIKPRLYIYISYILPHPYQYCTGQCTGNLSNCFCIILQSFDSFFHVVRIARWLRPLLQESAAYFLAFLAVIVILFIVYLVFFAIILILLVSFFQPFT